MADRMTPQQVADELGVSRSWVYENKHLIGYYQMGTAVRFERADVEAYDQRCKRGPSNGERNTWELPSGTGRNATAGWLRKRTTVSDINERLKGIEKGKSRRENMQQSARPN